MPSDLRAKPLPLGPAYEEDEGISEGARLGAPRPDWAEEEADETYEGEDHLEERGEGARRLLRAGLATLVLAAFAGLLWYAYEWGRGDRELAELPVVRADAGPEKIKPLDPGGLEVPYQDQLVLNREADAGGGVRVERLLPPPEVPLPMPAAGPLEPDAAIQPEAPREVTAVPVPEGTAPQPQPEAEAVPEPDPAPAPPPAKPEPAAKPEPVAEVAAAPAATQTPAPAAVPAGSYTLQLASLKNPGAAEAEWARLQASFPKLLGNRSLLLRPAEIAGVGKVYRLQAGPFASRGKADATCAKLKQKRQDCFVVTP